MNSEISIGDLVKKIMEIMKINLPIVDQEDRIRPSKSEVDRLFCDSKKLKTLSKWEPSYNLEQGLSETINWFRKNIDIYKSEQYNV